jgi:hypothetical protein
VGERLEPSHRFERAEVAQFHSAAIQRAHA